MFTASTAAVLNHSHGQSQGQSHNHRDSHLPQIEGANFLNLLIVDDDRTIREACREVAQSLGFNTQVAESAEQASACSTARAPTPCSSTYACPAQAAWKRCMPSRSIAPTRW
jgi:PleD family two-component response regulator